MYAIICCIFVFQWWNSIQTYVV